MVNLIGIFDLFPFGRTDLRSLFAISPTMVPFSEPSLTYNRNPNATYLFAA